MNTVAAFNGKKPIDIESINDIDLINFTKSDIFTPDDITKIMTSKLLNYGSLLEPSVGTGNLLKYIDIFKYNIIDVYELKLEYLNQVQLEASKSDKSQTSVVQPCQLNKYHCDFIKTQINKKYDNIIMNPPYIRIQDLSYDYRKYLKEHYTIINNGLIDIYYAFIIKCLNLLDENGVMVSITPNSYLYNKSAYPLRKYLFDNAFVKEIIDFKEKKVFVGTSVYCCITVFTKNPKTQLIYNGKHILYTDITKKYSLFNIGTNTNNRTLKDICNIRNGIATLRDKIFIHDSKLFDEPCWKLITNGPSDKFIIYPYENGIIMDETKFKFENPYTYEYLVKHKTELAKRDKGNKTYPQWYAYGRSQSIKYSNKKCIYIPCFVDPKNIQKNIFIKQNVLHFSCLCIEPYDNYTNDIIDIIINIIINNIDFIDNNSSKRSAGWINISSRVLYEIPFEHDI